MGYHYVKTDSGRIYETDSPDVWRAMRGAEVLPRAAGKALHIAQAKADLLDLVSPGATIWCVLRSVSASGMSRAIDFYIMRDDRPLWLSGYISVLMELRRAKRGLTVQGCGMDMGFHVVGNLAYRLFGAEGKLKSEWL